jgi:hypothetical protein
LLSSASLDASIRWVQPISGEIVSDQGGLAIRLAVLPLQIPFLKFRLARL